MSVFSKLFKPFRQRSSTMGEVYDHLEKMGRLKNERRRIERDFQLRSKAIDSALEVELERLRLVEVEIKGRLRAIAYQLEEQSRDRLLLREALEKGSKAMSNADLTPAERIVAHETVRVLSAMLVESGRSGVKALGGLSAGGRALAGRSDLRGRMLAAGEEE